MAPDCHDAGLIEYARLHGNEACRPSWRLKLWWDTPHSGYLTASKMHTWKCQWLHTSLVQSTSLLCLLPWHAHAGQHTFVLRRPANQILPRLFSRLGRANNALVRTTVVPTLAEMGVALNVVPMHASITVDMRNLPGDVGPEPRRFMYRMLHASGHPVMGGEPPASVGGKIKAHIAAAIRKVRASCGAIGRCARNHCDRTVTSGMK